jgi:hypothetical protein
MKSKKGVSWTLPFPFEELFDLDESSREDKKTENNHCEFDTFRAYRVATILHNLLQKGLEKYFSKII